MAGSLADPVLKAIAIQAIAVKAILLLGFF
jgi:hypothetical protein